MYLSIWCPVALIFLFSPTKGFLLNEPEIFVNSAPYTAHVELHNKQDKHAPPRFLATGTILSCKWVLTAALPLQGYTRNDIRIRSGTNKIGSYGGVHPVRKIVRHPSFDENTKERNLAMVELFYKFLRSSTVCEFPVWTQNPRASVVLTGFPNVNRGTVLQKYDHLNFLPQNECKSKVHPLPSNSLCLRNPPMNIPGNAAVIDSKGLRAVFQWKQNNIGVFADVSAYLPWINSCLANTTYNDQSNPQLCATSKYSQACVVRTTSFNILMQELQSLDKETDENEMFLNDLNELQRLEKKLEEDEK